MVPGTVVNWRVYQAHKFLKAGSFVTTPPDRGYHFLTQEIGSRFSKHSRKAVVAFNWQMRGTSYKYTALRATGC